MEWFYLSAFGMGLATSLHCLGMCGPLALALPTGEQNPYIGRTLYNTGRIITYSAFGAIAGLFGEGFALVGYQQMLSIICGVILISYFVLNRYTKWEFIKFKLPFTQFLSPLLAKYIQAPPTYTRLLVFGILNGALPCGAVYIALAAALGTGNVVNAILFMILFGAGTFPLMYIISLGYRLNFFRKFRPTYYLQFFSFLVGVLFVLRGLNLGIPYVSPAFSTEPNQTTKVHKCH